MEVINACVITNATGTEIKKMIDICDINGQGSSNFSFTSTEKTSQANIVRKLSIAKKMNPTLKALIALDEIVMTDYLLGYIDDKEERMIVQNGLNRGESYHQLASTISKINGGKMLHGKNEMDLNINAQCIRLIANIIIHHTASILSALYQHYKLKDPKKCKKIVRWSPIAWRFVNLIGNYEFYKKIKIIDNQ